MFIDVLSDFYLCTRLHNVVQSDDTFAVKTACFCRFDCTMRALKQHLTCAKMPNIALNSDDRGQVQGWLQVDKRAHQKMWRFGLKNPTGLVVLHFLTSRLHRGTNGVVMSYAAMAQAIGIADRTAKTAIAALAEAKFIQILKSGKSNVYIINSQVAWQGNRGSRFAAFNAEIVVAESEQSESVDKLIEDSKSLETVPQLIGDERLMVGNESIDPPDQQEMDLS